MPELASLKCEVSMSATRGCRSDEGSVTGTPPTKPWSAPQLVRVGSVAALTSKKDLVGRNDGGSGTMKRT